MDKIRYSSFNSNHPPEGRTSWKTLRQVFDLGGNHTTISGPIVVLVLVMGALLTWTVYQLWAGFNQEDIQDWLVLFIVPMILIGGVILFNWAMRKNEQRAQHDLKIAEWYVQHEREIESERFREAAFQAYLDRMTELLLEKGLRRSRAGAEVRDIARARTLTVLRGLDGVHKGILLRFLYETELIKNKPIIDLAQADLSGAHLKKADLSKAGLLGANLSGADLSGANLNQTDLYRATLIVADLSGADLRRANLSKANLTEALLAVANISEADLTCADLHGANLEGVDLIGTIMRQADLREAILIVANLVEANLSGAILRGANLEAADLIEANRQGTDLSQANLKGTVLRGAEYNSHTKWPKDINPVEAGAILVD